MTDFKGLEPQAINELTAGFSADRANRIARNAVTSDDVHKAARNISVMRTYHDSFCVSRPRTGEVTNQRHSGRCWYFAATNVARANTMELLDVDTFEFSQTYGMFYDKLEKFNVGLGRIIKTADQPTSSREVSLVLHRAMGDGNWYVDAMNLIAKWGLVPKSAMPETACTKDSTQMNTQLERLFRRSALILRRMAADGATTEELLARRAEFVADCHRILSICLGEPPLTFDLVVPVGKKCKVPADKLVEQTGEGPDFPEAKKPRRLLVDRGITPQQFLERYVKLDPTDFVALVSTPGADRPYNTLYRERLVTTVEAGMPVQYVNVPAEVLEDAAIASLKAGVPVQMECDVSKQFGRHLPDFPGVLGTDTMDFEGLFGVELGMSREDMIDVFETGTTHAMTFQGVQLDDDGRPVAWRIENSWGKDACKDGYLIASAEWFRTYGTAIAVRKQFVDAELVKLWETGEPVVIDPWTPLSAAVCAAE